MPQYASGDMTIGSDPEGLFFDISTNQFVRADSIHTRHRNSWDGCRCSFGIDGAPHTVELRPGYATCPLEHAEQVHEALVAGERDLDPNIIFLAGSGVWKPTGGHIHFNTVHGPRVLNVEAISTALNNYLSPIMMLLANRSNWVRRVQGGSYGYYSDVRSGSRVEHGGIEYRSPPSWLASRGVTEALLSFTYVVADAAQLGVLPTLTFMDTHEGRSAYSDCNKDFARQHLKAVFDAVKQAPLYEKYSTQIQALWGMVRLGLEWNEDVDVFARWGIREEAHSRTTNIITASSDSGVRDIVVAAQSALSDRDRATEMYVYGVAVGREGDIVVSDRDLAAAVAANWPNMDVRVARYGSARAIRGPAIGLSTHLRHYRVSDAAFIVRDAAQALASQ